VRLGFAVAVHVDPDILLIDEVLAVGDEAFQRRCLDKIGAFQQEGRTIVLVTHALDTVVSVCDRAVMLERGRVHAQGAPMDVVTEMRHRLLRDDPRFIAEEGTREVEIKGVELMPAGAPGNRLEPDQSLTIQIDVIAHTPVPDLDVSFAILSEETNEPVVETRTSAVGRTLGPLEGSRRVRFLIPPADWVSGKYFVTVGLESPDGHPYHIQTQRYSFEVHADRAPAPLGVRPDVEIEEP